MYTSVGIVGISRHVIYATKKKHKVFVFYGEAVVIIMI